MTETTEVRDMAITNARIAKLIRQVDAEREGSWNGKADNGHGRYEKTYSECIYNAVGDDPIGIILFRLFTAGFSDMYQFAEIVLDDKEIPNYTRR